MHEPTFRRACAEAGLNPFLCEMANIREHCSWVHEKGEATTRQGDRPGARDGREGQAEPAAATRSRCRSPRRALVIGGGIAGIQAALDIANAGHKVILVEREPSIGGHMAQLSETFPTLDCSQCILTPRMVEVAQHPNITLYTYSRAGEPRRLHRQLQGEDPQEGAQRRREALHRLRRSAPRSARTKKIPSEFNAGLGTRTAIYVPFPQAVPNKPVIDREHCTYFRKGKCEVCEKVCPTKAIRYDQEDEIVEVEVGAMVAGHRASTSSTADFFPEYGYGKYKDVITGLQFERLASASGPDPGRDQAALRRQGAGDGRLRRLRRLARPGQGHRLLLEDLLHVHGQARHALQAQGARRQGLRLLHGHPRRRQDVRGVRAPGDRGGRRAVHPRPRLARSTSATASSSSRAPTRCSAAGRSRSRPTWWCWPRPMVAKPGAEELAQKLHVSYDAVPLLRRGAPEAAAGGDEHRRHLPGRRLPGAEGHPGDGGPGLGRRGQGRRPLLARTS